MTTLVAFLRGINLGRRQVRSADLRDEFEKLGFAGVRTLLASGNVIFEGEDQKGLQQGIERALERRFGFGVGTVLRTQEELRALVRAEPFGEVEPGADVMRYVLFFGAPLDPLPSFEEIPDHLEIRRVARREIYVLAHRLPNGRYSEGMERLDRQLPKGSLVTARNWNTVVKAAEK